MHEVYIQLVCSAIIENFDSEQSFYQNQLGITVEEWYEWKQGTKQLAPEMIQKIKNLFSDYEWMLVQKIMRQTIIYPEKRLTAVYDYRRMKTEIARKWLNAELATVEIIQQPKDRKNAALIDLRVTIDYAEWGFDDILSFRLPSTIQHQLRKEHVALLDWVNQNLEETYTNN